MRRVELRSREKLVCGPKVRGGIADFREEVHVHIHQFLSKSYAPVFWFQIEITKLCCIFCPVHQQEKANNSVVVLAYPDAIHVGVIMHIELVEPRPNVRFKRYAIPIFLVVKFAMAVDYKSDIARVKRCSYR